jgi:hypothetical protein
MVYLTRVVAARPRIGGWLILPALGIVAAPIADGYSLYSVIDTWGEAAPAFRPLLGFEGVFSAAMIGFELFVAVAFFQRRASAPNLVIAWLVARLLGSLVDYGWLSTILTGPQASTTMANVATGMIRTLIATALWASYFRKSVRVQQTFNPQPEDAAALG